MIFRHIYWAASVFIYFLRLGLAEQPHVIGSDAILPHDPRQDHERYLGMSLGIPLMGRRWT